MLKKLRAQSLLEYTLLISVVVLAIVTMFPQVKRTSQSLIGILSDQIGDQRNAEQSFTSNDSYLVESRSSSAAVSQTDTFDRYGVVSHMYSDDTKSQTITLSNTGFTEQEKGSPTNQDFFSIEIDKNGNPI